MKKTPYLPIIIELKGEFKSRNLKLSDVARLFEYNYNRFYMAFYHNKLSFDLCLKFAKLFKKPIDYYYIKFHKQRFLKKLEQLKN